MYICVCEGKQVMDGHQTRCGQLLLHTSALYYLNPSHCFSFSSLFLWYHTRHHT
jgi:hypothetical protein